MGLVIVRHARSGFTLDDAGGETAATAATGTVEFLRVAIVVVVVDGLDARDHFVEMLMLGFKKLLVVTGPVEAQSLLGLHKLLLWMAGVMDLRLLLLLDSMLLMWWVKILRLRPLPLMYIAPVGSSG